MISLCGTNVEDNPKDVTVAKINGDLIEMPLNEGDVPGTSPSEGTGSTSQATGSASKSPSSTTEPEDANTSWIIWVVIGVAVVAVVVIIIAVASKKKKNGGSDAPKDDNQPKAE